jgi:tetratricopeptide (TPR) repeat protein
MPSLTRNAPAPQAFAVLCGAGLLIAAAGCGKRRDDAKELIARAEALAGRGLEVEGAKLLVERLESLPPSERGRVRAVAAGLYHRGEVYNSALEHSEAAERLGAGGVEVAYVRADCLRRLERFVEAREALEKLLQAEPGYHRARFALAAILFRTADPEAALPLFDAYFAAASPEEHEYKEALEEHGRALRAAGKFRESADRFVTLLEKDPLDGDLYSELAASLYRLRLRREGRFVEEVWKLVSRSGFQEYVERGLERTGLTALALGQKAANRQRQRRFLEAFQNYHRAALIDSEHPLIPFYLAELALRFRRFRDAAGAAEKGAAEGRQPASGLLWAAARARIEAGDAAGSLAAADRAAAAYERACDGQQGIEISV